MLDKNKHIQLASVCDIGNGFAFKSTEFKSSGIPLLRISNIDNERVSFGDKSVYVDKAYLSTHDKFVVKKGDVIIALSGATTGKYGVYELDTPALLNQRIGIIKQEDSSSLNSRYFYFYLNLLKAEILRKAQGAAQPNISTKELGQFKIPLPPLEEQKKIAEILDAADSLRQKDQKLVEHYDRLSQSLFLEMFGDPVTNPMGWEKLSLEDMVDFLTSGSRGWAKYYTDSGDIFIRIQNVGKNELMLNDLTYVDAPDNAESKRTAVQAGDILLSITADLGRTAVIPSDLPKAHINQHLAIIRLKKDYNPYYVSEFIASEGGKRQFMKLDKGGVKAGLNFTDIRSLKLLNPPMEIQNQYLQRIKQIKRQKLMAEESLKKSDDLFNSLLQKAFKGELTAS